jgi:hypothetical protein
MNMRQVPLDLQQMRHMQHNDQMSKNMAAVSTRMLDERMLNEEQSDMRRGSMGSMGMMQQQMQQQSPIQQQAGPLGYGKK